MKDIFVIILGIAGMFCGVILFIKKVKSTKLIDTESVAVVKKVQPLGLDDLKKVYAITFDVMSSEPFELLETPCKKELKIGKQKTVFYEHGNAQANHYFKTIGTFDNRLVLPAALVLMSLLAIVGTIYMFFV